MVCVSKLNKAYIRILSICNQKEIDRTVVVNITVDSNYAVRSRISLILFT